MSGLRDRARTEEWLRRVSEGDADSFAALYDAHAPLVRGICRRIVGEHCEDVAQEVFLQVWNRAGDFDPDRGDPVSWICVIARSRSLDHLRRTRSRTDVRPPPSAPRPIDVADRIAVRDALAELPVRERAVLELSFYEDLSQSQIATSLGQPLGTVKSRMRLGLERLRRTLTPALA